MACVAGLRMGVGCEAERSSIGLAAGVQIGCRLARAAGSPLEIGGPRQRAVLALLLLHANHVVSSDRLIDDVWGERPPRSAASTLQSYVSRLRRTLGAHALWSAQTGYELRVAPERIDLHRFRALAIDGRAHLASGEPKKAVAALQEALSLWRGEPSGDLAYDEWASRGRSASRAAYKRA